MTFLNKTHLFNMVLQRPFQQSVVIGICCVILSSCATNKEPVFPDAATHKLQHVEVKKIVPKPLVQNAVAECEAINVKVRNLTGREINIVGVEFYDYKNHDWRPVNISKATVSRGKGWNHYLELQDVNGNRTRAKINYLVKPRSKSGSNEPILKTAETKPKTCSQLTRFFKSVR